MEAPDRRAAELNEVRWWSRWARLRWRGEGYLLTSKPLAEPFFNRAGALTCGGVAGTAPWAESFLSRLGMSSTVVVFDSCPAAKKLLASGYMEVDSMAVLLSKSPIRREWDEGKEIETSRSPRSWTAAYLRSFYGDEGLAGVVAPIVAPLLKAKAVTLLESRVRGKTAGVLAIFRTPGIAGVYCVGTVPEFRGLGVATALLARAREIAAAEERSMVLQTLWSDGLLRFYMERGFEEMYSKRLLERKFK
ncbi:MAG: GNAT family N-acetyltransferase [Thaumarchaeota archaeon]|nr:GNAT family N-acetyltransferase [Nitrososphaerota archaeon]